jgi:hypothetical protein
MLQAFEVPTPSLVINLMPSFYYPCFFERQCGLGLTEQERQDVHGMPIHTCFGNGPSFIIRNEATQACRRLSNFFKEVLLPLAAESNAIIICPARNDDQLSTTLAECMPLFTAKSGGKLPFTVLAVSDATQFAHNTMYNPDSLVSELSNKSKNWKKGRQKLEHVWKKNGDTRPKEKWAKLDVQPQLVNYVIIEAVSRRNPDTWNMNPGPMVTFSNEVLQALSDQLPTLCLRTGGTIGSVSLTPNVDLASRDIPVLMLDTQTRPSLGDLLMPLKTRAQEAGIDEDNITIASKANNPERALIELIVQEITDSELTDATTLRAELEPMMRDELITKSIQANTVRHQELWAAGKVQSYDLHDLAYFFDVLNDDGDVETAVSLLSDKSGGTDLQSLYESLQDAEAADAENGSQPFTPAQLERVINHMVEMMAQGHLRCMPASQIEKLAPGFDPTSPKLQQAVTIDGSTLARTALDNPTVDGNDSPEKPVLPDNTFEMEGSTRKSQHDRRCASVYFLADRASLLARVCV